MAGGSQEVLGSAPMNMKTRLSLKTRSVFSVGSSIVALRPDWLSSASDVISHPTWSSTFGRAEILSIRDHAIESVKFSVVLSAGLLPNAILAVEQAQ